MYTTFKYITQNIILQGKIFSISPAAITSRTQYSQNANFVYYRTFGFQEWAVVYVYFRHIAGSAYYRLDGLKYIRILLEVRDYSNVFYSEFRDDSITAQCL